MDVSKCNKTYICNILSRSPDLNLKFRNSDHCLLFMWLEVDGYKLQSKAC